MPFATPSHFSSVHLEQWGCRFCLVSFFRLSVICDEQITACREIVIINLSLFAAFLFL